MLNCKEVCKARLGAKRLHACQGNLANFAHTTLPAASLGRMAVPRLLAPMPTSGPAPPFEGTSLPKVAAPFLQHTV